MLRDLDQTLEIILYDKGKIPRGEIDIAFDTPTGEWATSLNRPTLNLWCFDLRENVMRRVSGIDTRVNGNQARKQFPPRRIDLSYLVTAWARKVEDEHMLIWRALQTLKRFPILKPDECEGALKYQEQNMPVLVAEPNEMGINLTDLWSVLDNQMKLGFITVITLELDPEIGFDAPLVLEATVTVGQSLEPLKRTITTPDVEIRHPRKKPASTESEEG
jgi:hypothetical protein